MTGATRGGGRRGLVYEVAVTLPVAGTYTYRDPRADGSDPSLGLLPGMEVVVPFGTRTVTGFVLGPAEVAADGKEIRNIEAVVGEEPAFDAGMIALCRFAADYYQAPLGEVMRAALPQGERGSSRRSVVLTDRGRGLLSGAQPLGDGMRQTALAGVDPGRRESEVPGAPLLRLLADSGGRMTLRALLKRAGARGPSLIARLEAAGWIEIGDDVRGRKADRRASYFVATSDRDMADLADRERRLPRRAIARRVLLERLRAAGATGLAARALGATDRAHGRALVGLGLARVDARIVREELGAGDEQAGGRLERHPLPPTQAQAQALEALAEALDKGFATFLLQGVTGSGKTEVYLQVIARARAAGRGALVLVPEIALTPQLASRFRARFGDDVAVLHSALPSRERLEAWRRLRSGEVGIALGARSAIFAPVRALGVVVVDEEHDPSFKQEEGVRYHARDLALVRARQSAAIAILGSATPSLESARNAEEGRFRRLLLGARATPRPLPSVEIVDLRRHPPGPDGLFSTPLAEAVAATLAAGQQTILFLNRRGFSPLLLCRACGHVARCPHCAVSFTYHRGRERLVCHYCGTTTEVPPVCPACRAPRLERLGIGTEQVESLVRDRFPDARVGRLDRDTAGQGAGRMTTAGGLAATLAAMQAGEIDVLVGTQMVTKGHDFGGVTLVGVLHPDQALHLPDFRAAERTFQLLEQVGGRAGRGDRAGRVIIQTYAPDHPAIVAAQAHDYEGFAREELRARAELGYPPFARMVVLRLDGSDETSVAADAEAAADAARAAGEGRVRLRGPAPAPIARVRGRTRYQVWLSARDRAPLHAAARAAARVKRHGDVRLIVDVDPQSTL